ncbi:MAG: hypothetical protein ACE5GC_01230 [Acidimicrobiia bacterium]
MVRPEVWHAPGAGARFAVTHPYVRRFWTAAIGPGAVADLLRLATAAQRGRSLRRPVHLGRLMTLGLVAAPGGRLLVSTTIPPLPVALAARRLTPDLARQHRRALALA